MMMHGLANFKFTM